MEEKLLPALCTQNKITKIKRCNYLLKHSMENKSIISYQWAVINNDNYQESNIFDSELVLVVSLRHFS